MNITKKSMRTLFHHYLPTVAIIGLALCGYSHLLAKETTTAPSFTFEEPFTVKSKTFGRNKITVLEDVHQKLFILKDHDIEGTIHETLGPVVANNAHINCNQVELFPAQDPIIQQYTKRAATLHVYIPGKEAWGKNIDIQKGITSKSNLESLINKDNNSIDKNLCDITALNIYLDNPDCHNGNLIVDEHNNFHAIDMDCIFINAYWLPNIINEKTNYEKDIMWNILPPDLLSTKTYDFMKNVNAEELSALEIKALKRVNKKLTLLVEQNPPTQLHNTWMNLAKKVNYNYSEDKKENIKILLEYNTHEIKRLISYMNIILKK